MDEKLKLKMMKERTTQAMMAGLIGTSQAHVSRCLNGLRQFHQTQKAVLIVRWPWLRRHLPRVK